MSDEDYPSVSARQESAENRNLTHETPTFNEFLSRAVSDSINAAEESTLDRWVESLDYYVSTGASMTLSATRTINLRDMLVAIRDYIYRTLPDDVDLPMPNDIWEMAWRAWLTRHETTEGEPVQERRQYEECRACGYIMFDRGAGVCDNCGSWGR